MSAPAALADDGRGLPLAPSAASAQQVGVFAAGCCHLLALALHDRHGLALRALGAPADEYSMWRWRGLGSVRHVYCLSADGRPVDVHGVFADEAAIRRFFAAEHDHDEPLRSVTVTAGEVRDVLPDRFGFRAVYSDELALAARHAQGLGLHTLAAAT